MSARTNTAPPTWVSLTLPTVAPLVSRSVASALWPMARAPPAPSNPRRRLPVAKRTARARGIRMRTSRRWVIGSNSTLARGGEIIRRAPAAAELGGADCAEVRISRCAHRCRWSLIRCGSDHPFPQTRRQNRPPFPGAGPSTCLLVRLRQLARVLEDEQAVVPVASQDDALATPVLSQDH